MTPADVAWKLYREGPGRAGEALELARGIVYDQSANPDDVAKAGTLLFAAGAFDEAEHARTTALAGGAAPALLAYLDTACVLRTGDGDAARRALAGHLAVAADPLHPDMAWLAAQVGAPRLAWSAARRADLGYGRSVSLTLVAAAHRAPRRTCRVNCAV
jgi:hypothetical protein